MPERMFIVKPADDASSQDMSAVINTVETRQHSGKRAASDTSWGASMARVIEAGVRVRHGPPVPALNRALSFVARRTLGEFFALTLAVFVLCSLVLAALLLASSCWCVADADGEARAFGRLALVVFRQLAAGGGAEYLGARGAARAPWRCAALAAAADYLGLLLQTVLLGLLAAKFCAPPSNRLMFSSNCALISRDGAPTLSFRVAHPQGHLVSNFAVSLLWIRPGQSAEGEKRMVCDRVECATHRAELDVPLDISHAVSAASPLAPWAADVTRAPGFVAVTCSGYDTSLTCDIFGCHWYKLADVVATAPGQAWHECVTRSKIKAAEDGGRAAVDLGFLDSLRTATENPTRNPTPGAGGSLLSNEV